MSDELNAENINYLKYLPHHLRMAGMTDEAELIEEEMCEEFSVVNEESFLSLRNSEAILQQSREAIQRSKRTPRSNKDSE